MVNTIGEEARFAEGWPHESLYVAAATLDHVCMYVEHRMICMFVDVFFTSSYYLAD